MSEQRKKNTFSNTPIKAGFDDTLVFLRLDQIAPLKVISPRITESRKYKQILASIQEIGIIEPPVVVRDSENSERYILLDGHQRLEAMKHLQQTEILCLVSSDNEAFTYNKHVNRLSPIQEHKMILAAIQRGVSQEKIAKALDIEPKYVKERKNLLNGVCSEAVELLKDKIVPIKTFQILRNMKPDRQIDAASLMNSSNNYSNNYASALLAGTPKSQLVSDKKEKYLKGISSDDVDRMENEMVNVQREFKLIEENYNQDVFTLMLIKGYIGRMMQNAKIVRYLAQHHRDILAQFQQISEMTTLKGKEMAMA